MVKKYFFFYKRAVGGNHAGAEILLTKRGIGSSELMMDNCFLQRKAKQSRSWGTYGSWREAFWFAFKTSTVVARLHAKGVKWVGWSVDFPGGPRKS